MDNEENKGTKKLTGIGNKYNLNKHWIRTDLEPQKYLEWKFKWIVVWKLELNWNRIKSGLPGIGIEYEMTLNKKSFEIRFRKREAQKHFETE